RAADSRCANKDSHAILIRDAACSKDGAVVAQPIEVAQVELADVGDPLDGHDQSLEAEAPGEHRRLQAQWLRHLRPENAAAAELHPTAIRQLDLWLHARLRVRKVSGTELGARETEPTIELLDHADQLSEVRAFLHHDALDLMEFRQMREVDRIGPEDASDDERLPRRVRVLAEPSQGDRCRVRTKDRAFRLLAVPLVPPTRAPGR